MTQRILLFLLLVLSSLTFHSEQASAQNSANLVFTNAEIAIKNGKAKALARYFLDDMDLTMDNKKGNYSQNQAEIMMQDFFSAYPPSDFRYLHKGSSNSGIQYGIAKFTSSNKSFRVYIVVAKKGDIFLIETLDITEDS